MGTASKPAEPGKLLTIEEVSGILNGGSDIHSSSLR
jgi:hypothetical protein